MKQSESHNAYSCTCCLIPRKISSKFWFHIPAARRYVIARAGSQCFFLWKVCRNWQKGYLSPVNLWGRHCVLWCAASWNNKKCLLKQPNDWDAGLCFWRPALLMQNYSEQFVSYTLDDFRMPPNVFDILSSIDEGCMRLRFFLNDLDQWFSTFFM